MKQPEIRFNGFSDEWNIAKLGDVLKIPEKVEATVTNNEQLLTVKLHGGGVHVMPSNKLLKLGSTKYYVRKAGQLIYGKQNFFNGSIAIIPLELDGKASSGDVPSFDIVNADAVYLYQKISQPEFYKRTEDWASGTGSKRLHEKTIQQFKIQLPTLPEQQKIGSLFSKYDAIIGLREQKLEELNALKKGLLQQMFPKDGAKVPELRFAGFADEWVEKKLGEIGLIQTGNTPSTSELANYSEDGLIWITPTDITSSYVTNSRKRLSKIGEKKSRIAETGSILVTSIASIGKNTIVIERAAFNQQINALTPTSKNDSYFLLAQSKEWSDRMKNIASKGTMDIVNKSTFSNIRVYVPTLPEQQKIGQLFKHLDARISNEQSKIEQLKDQKQGLLQRML